MMLKSKKFDWWIMVKVPQMRSTWPFGFMAGQTITCLVDLLRSILGCHCSRDRFAAAGSKKDHLENPSKQWSKSCLCSWCRKLYYVYRSIHYIYPMQLWLMTEESAITRIPNQPLVVECRLVFFTLLIAGMWGQSVLPADWKQRSSCNQPLGVW